MENVVVVIRRIPQNGHITLATGPHGSPAGLERFEHMYMPEFMIALCEWLLDSPCIVYGGIAGGGLVCLAYVVVMELGFSIQQNPENWD